MSHGRERGSRYRRALALGLLGSALLHLALLLTVGRVEVGGRSASPPSVRPTPLEGLLVVPLEEAPQASEVAPPRRPEEAPSPRRAVTPVPVEPGRLPAGEAEPAEGDLLTNAERLRPRLGDERLWVDFRDPLRPGGPRSERYAEAVHRLQEIIRVWLDSLQLSEEQRRRALDWTFGKGDERWGISPEGLHLGNITIPIPFGTLFQQGGPLGREAQQALRDLREIRGQEARRTAEETMEERREAMRERSREAAERRENDTTKEGDPPRAPP